MDLTNYLVSTTMGDSVLEAKVKTYVQVSSKKFLSKTAEDLKPGDLVMYAKPYTTTTLEDVEPHLIKSPRYKKAQELLHEENSRGEQIPKLRAYLIRGLAEQGIVSQEKLESKILFENDDFSKSEYERMCTYTQELLNLGDETQITEARVNNWLRGDVIAPRNWSLLERLGRTINPQFQEFQYGSQEADSMYFNYRLYVVVRQGVMRFLNQARGTTSAEEWKEGENLISLSPEYAIVFQHFLKDLNPDHALARVTRVTKIRELERVLEDGSLIEGGVVRKTPQFHLPEKTYAETFDDMKLLRAYLWAAIEDFDCGEMNILWNDTIRFSRLSKASFAIGTEPFLIECFGEELDPEIKQVKKEVITLKGYELQEPKDLSDEDFMKAGIKFGNRIKEALFLGGMDSYFSFKRGTMMNLLESYFRTRTAMPPLLFENTVCIGELKINSNLSRKDRREKEREIIKNNVILKKRYGLEINEIGGIVKRTIMFSDGFPSVMSDNELMSRREYVKKRREDPEAFKGLIYLVKHSIDPEVCLFTRGKVSQILKEYQLSDIIDLRKEDFYYEDFQ